ncbi:MAG: trypsin-like peptidase domain-containing protein [bacterium]|nr:trypsin-like peptidase domain-containing protein [bacterium]
MSKNVLWIIVSVVMMATVPVLGEADPAATAAQGLMKSYSKAIVHVEAVVKITAEGGMPGMNIPEQEQKVKVLGTVVDPSGLTVVPFLDPTKALGPVKINAGGQAIELTFKGEVSEVKFRLADGTELPGKVVMTDDDLSLVFVAPEKALDKETQAKINHVDLGASAKKASVLDKIITLARLGKTLNHALNVRLGRISSVVTKPRTFYIGSGSLGSPVFTSDGKLLGICTRRAANGQGKTMGMMSALSGGGAAAAVTPVILPAADVKEIADQAKEAMKKSKTEKDES